MAQHLFICTYEFQGQETEGNLQQEESFVCSAEDKVEAIYKYHVYLWYRKGKVRPFELPSLEEYRKMPYADGGWGYRAMKLDPENWQYENDKNIFFIWSYEEVTGKEKTKL